VGQDRFSVPLWGRKREWYLMKGCMTDFSNLLDSNRERVAFNIFCVLLFFKNIAVTWQRGLHYKNYFKRCHELRNIKADHKTHQWRKFLSNFKNKSLPWRDSWDSEIPSRRWVLISGDVMVLVLIRLQSCHYCTICGCLCSLQAGSPLSRARAEKSKAIRRQGVWWRSAKILKTKMVTMVKMDHTWKNGSVLEKGSHLEKWVTLEKWVNLREKKSRNDKNGSHLEKRQTFEKWVTLGKMGHI